MEYLTEKEAAKVLDISFWSLNKWRYQKTGPKYYILPKGKIRYLKEDLINWQEDNKITVEPKG